ncbi:MAG: hypothetical protein ACRCY4_08325 [Brevinema sp.]
MKKMVLILLIVAGCSAVGDQNRSSDGTFPPNSEIAQQFLQNITDANLVFPTGEAVTIINQTIDIPGDETYTLDSVLDRNRAFFTRPVTLSDGTMFPGFSGIILSNNTLYFASKRIIIRPDSENVTVLLAESKGNVDLTKIAVNTDGSLQTIATIATP